MTDDPDPEPDGAQPSEVAGHVSLVGSGPGDPELLTVKARRLLDEADVVLHDKLPGPEIISLVPEDKREDVGKRAGGEWTPQEYTNRRLVELAREGHHVVRLGRSTKRIVISQGNGIRVPRVQRRFAERNV